MQSDSRTFLTSEKADYISPDIMAYRVNSRKFYAVSPWWRLWLFATISPWRVHASHFLFEMLERPPKAETCKLPTAMVWIDGNLWNLVKVGFCLQAMVEIGGNLWVEPASLLGTYQYLFRMDAVVDGLAAGSLWFSLESIQDDLGTESTSCLNGTPAPASSSLARGISSSGE